MTAAGSIALGTARQPHEARLRDPRRITTG